MFKLIKIRIPSVFLDIHTFIVCISDHHVFFGSHNVFPILFEKKNKKIKNKHNRKINTLVVGFKKNVDYGCIRI